MIPWELIDRAEVPKVRGKAGQGMEIAAGSELVLYRRGDEYTIRVDNWELMNSRSVGSEQEIAPVACQRLATHESPCVLIGGLGLGFTLRSALDHLPTGAKVIVAELVPAVVDWNREHLGHLADHPLADPRVEVYLGDVAERIRTFADTHDAIVLDVDNGPHTKASASEGWLYSREGLDACRRSLRPHGILSIWSAGTTVGFASRIEQRGFRVEELRSRGRGHKGNLHRIWLAQRTD